ncbi:hypothetical protein [Asticcacaulis taihuensis]|uniref:hypothetical protein n=1 Tax=Asticcacaulis taihuensis TaxID=260084 RepID=UPI003F7C4801
MEKPSDGGKPYLPWNLSAGHDLREDERELVQALGTAVVMRWFDLPRDIQKRLFEAAVSGPQTLREPLAKFLHAHGES